MPITANDLSGFEEQFNDLAWQYLDTPDNPEYHKAEKETERLCKKLKSMIKNPDLVEEFRSAVVLERGYCEVENYKKGMADGLMLCMMLGLIKRPVVKHAAMSGHKGKALTGQAQEAVAGE